MSWMSFKRSLAAAHADAAGGALLATRSEYPNGDAGRICAMADWSMAIPAAGSSCGNGRKAHSPESTIDG